MAKAVYTAYATLKDKASRSREFGSGKKAVAWIRRIVNEGGSGFVTHPTKDGLDVIFNSHDGHGGMRKIDYPEPEENACEEL